jgi:hypothetical protein
MLVEARGTRLDRVLVLASRRPPTLSGTGDAEASAGPVSAMIRATTARPVRGRPGAGAQRRRAPHPVLQSENPNR